MADLVALADEHVRDRQLVAGVVLGVVVAVVEVVPRGEQPQIAPPALAREGADALRIGLGDDGEVEPALEMQRGAVERVEDRCARRARGLGERQLPRLAAWTRARVAR